MISTLCWWSPATRAPPWPELRDRIAKAGFTVAYDENGDVRDDYPATNISVSTTESHNRGFAGARLKIRATS